MSSSIDWPLTKVGYWIFVLASPFAATLSTFSLQNNRSSMSKRSHETMVASPGPSDKVLLKEPQVS